MNKVKVFMALVAASLMFGPVNAVAQDETVAAPEAAPAAAAQDVTFDEVNEIYTQAGTLAGEKKYGEAADMFQQVIDKGERVGEEADELVGFAKQLIADCYWRAASPFLKEQKYEEAIPYLMKARAAGDKYNDPNTALKAGQSEAKVYSILAATAFNDKDYPKAIEIYKKGYEANPRDTEVALNLAMSYLEMVPADTTGYRIYSAVIALGDVHTKYAVAAATAKEKYAYYKTLEAGKHATAKEYGKVIETAAEAIAVDPANAEAYLLTVQAATNMKNFDKVIEAGEAAAAAQTDPALKSNVYFMMGAAYENKGNTAKAIESYRKVVAGGNVAMAKEQITSLSK